MITIDQSKLTGIVKSNILRFFICLSLPIITYWIFLTSYAWWWREWEKVAVISSAFVFIIALTATSNLKSMIWKMVLSVAISLAVFIAEFSVTFDVLMSLGLAGAAFLIIIVFAGRYKRFEASLINTCIIIKGICLRSLGIEIFIFNFISLLAGSGVFAILEYFNPSLRPSSFIIAIIAYIIFDVLLIRSKVLYLKEIAGGILEISKGNLDFTVAEKGEDEFKVLAQNINHMSIQLKNKIEDEKRAEQTKNELITNVSHDLKTPLTTIIGYLTLLNDKKYETQDHLDEYVSKAYAKSLKLKKLIEDLFEYTKLSNGIIQINKTTIDLIELVEQQLGEISILAKQNNLCFVKKFSDPSIMVGVDSDLMARVLENILSNAIKYSYKDLPGNIVVTITQKPNQVHITIKNEGDTIPTELLPLLFERFFRVDASRNSRASGSGLGLAIAKSIVDLHDGHIYAESEANKITVCVVLPTV